MGNYFCVVLDGSVLKNDIKQQLAKERREERKRQQEGMYVTFPFMSHFPLCICYIFLTWF